MNQQKALGGCQGCEFSFFFLVGITHQGGPVSDEILRVCVTAYLKRCQELHLREEEEGDDDGDDAVDERNIRIMMLEVRMTTLVSTR